MIALFTRVSGEPGPGQREPTEAPRCSSPRGAPAGACCRAKGALPVPVEMPAAEEEQDRPALLNPAENRSLHGRFRGG